MAARWAIGKRTVGPSFRGACVHARIVSGLVKRLLRAVPRLALLASGVIGRCRLHVEIHYVTAPVGGWPGGASVRPRTADGFESLCDAHFAASRLCESYSFLLCLFASLREAKSAGAAGPARDDLAVAADVDLPRAGEAFEGRVVEPEDVVAELAPELRVVAGVDAVDGFGFR